MKRKSAVVAIVLGVVASIAFVVAHAATQAMTLQAGVTAQPIPDPLPIAVIGLAVIGTAIAARRHSERRGHQS
jgi:type III secretory pathway component EscT